MRLKSLLALLALAGCGASAPAPAPQDSQAEFPVKRCINLANALNAPVEGEWGYRIAETDLQTIAAAGFDTVRVAIDWHSHTSDDGPYVVDPDYFARIDEVIDQSLAAGLNVIIDMHDYDALKREPELHAARAVGIWRQIAERYQDYPDSLIFEPVNEPIYELSGERWFALAERLVAAIRETNPTRTLIIGGDDWSSLDGLMRLKLPDDPYLVATFHYYEPFDFTHQGAEWFEGAPPVGTGFGTQREIRAVQRDMTRAAAWARRNRTPLFLGEFGAIAKAPLDARARYARTVRKAAEANGIAWCYFDFAAGFEAYDQNADDWIPPMREALTADESLVLRR